MDFFKSNKSNSDSSVPANQPGTGTSIISQQQNKNITQNLINQSQNNIQNLQQSSNAKNENININHEIHSNNIAASQNIQSVQNNNNILSNPNNKNNNNNIQQIHFQNSVNHETANATNIPLTAGIETNPAPPSSSTSSPPKKSPGLLNLIITYPIESIKTILRMTSFLIQFPFKKIKAYGKFIALSLVLLAVLNSNYLESLIEINNVGKSLSQADTNIKFTKCKLQNGDESQNQEYTGPVILNPPYNNSLYKYASNLNGLYGVGNDKFCPTNQKPRLYFLKTHKTGSSTLQAIFFRKAYKTNSTVFFPKYDGKHVFQYPSPFRADMMDEVCRTKVKCDIMTNHAVYSKDIENHILPKNETASLCRSCPTGTCARGNTAMTPARLHRRW